MTIPNRTVSIKSVFASTAKTTIPTSPATGVSYRNTGTTAAEIGKGWAFKDIVDSAKFNEAMYEYTTICQQLEKYGFLPWSANTDYPAGGCALGSDGKIYQAKQATGPSSTSIEPTTDTNHTYWDLFYYATVTANRSLVSNGNGKVSASATTATEIGYVHGVTSAIQTQINNKANNNSVVHLTGNETIGGDKTFAAKNIFLKDSGDDRSSAPSSSRYAGYVIEDVNGERLAIFEKAHGKNGEITASMLVSRQGTTGAENQIGISVIYPSSGNGYATCPTPTEDTTKSKQIDTVGARNTRINDVLASLYPVGSIYIGTQSTCPLASLISGSTWTKISGDKVLQSSSSNHVANTTIAAGLPNIIGRVGFIKQEGSPTVREPSGAFSYDGESSNTYTQGDATGTSKLDYIKFSAQTSNAIYGKSSTVQPPAYVVNVWRRTA